MYFEVSRWTSRSSAPSPFQPPTAICIDYRGIICSVAARHRRIVGWGLQPVFLPVGGFWPFAFDLSGPPCAGFGYRGTLAEPSSPLQSPWPTTKKSAFDTQRIHLQLWFRDTICSWMGPAEHLQGLIRHWPATHHVRTALESSAW